jgi:hypothetical protein
MVVSTYTIYAMSGPDGAARYIGKTKYDVLDRVKAHIYAGRSRLTPLQCWVDDLRADLIIYELEKVSNNSDAAASRDALIAESCWITHFVKMGNELLNKNQMPGKWPVVIELVDGQKMTNPQLLYAHSAALAEMTRLDDAFETERSDAAAPFLINRIGKLEAALATHKETE